MLEAQQRADGLQAAVASADERVAVAEAEATRLRDALDAQAAELQRLELAMGELTYEAEAARGAQLRCRQLDVRSAPTLLCFTFSTDLVEVSCAFNASKNSSKGQHLTVVQEDLAQSQAAARAADGERLAAEADARRERGRAAELQVRCLAAEERCTALFEEVEQARAAHAESAARVAALEDEGLAPGDRGRVAAALGELLRGCVLLIEVRLVDLPAAMGRSSV